MRHRDVWRGLDELASRHGLTASGLAKQAGLDPTAFNRSKRASADGDKLRWPSTESLSRALDAVGASMEEFAALVEGRPGRVVKLIGLAQAGTEGFFDDAGFPVGGGWEEIRFPETGDAPVYALEITGRSMEPVYREGDRIVVSPDASLRRGDRIVVKTLEGEVMAKELGRMTEQTVELISLNADFEPRILDRSRLAWMARILWASQ
jgi:phage repressor protein C with HTH and peptisase S24 domain